MKRQTLIVAGLCLVVGLTSPRSYSQAGYVQGKIPFDFAVSGRTFPAGDYRMVSAPHQIKIEDSTGRAVAMVLANDAVARSAEDNDRIVFHCYRDRCFLAEVWSGQQKGRQVLPSRAEAELAKEEQGKYFAVLGERPRR
ncbi:MAG TPA: hypothetical protein VEI52_16670 [Terriglobales bacterium]|nr:hypothetical protein [Terriglobales bacterium]